MEAKKTFADFLAGETPVLLDFTATWCGPCKMMAPVLDELKHKLGEKIHILKIDVDRNPQAASHYGVQGVPTLILYKDRQVRWRQSGVVPAGVLEKIILENSK